jgi:hypothetical protein
MNKPPTNNPMQDPTSKLLAYLEKSQGAFFVNLAIARYHPVALLQLFVIAAIASAVMTVQNKRLIKQVEQTVHSQAGALPTQLDKLTAEDKQRISKIKALRLELVAGLFYYSEGKFSISFKSLFLPAAFLASIKF